MYKEKLFIPKDEVYIVVVIEKILDNSIFSNLEESQMILMVYKFAVLESKIKDLEKNFEILGQFSELKNLF